MKRLFILTIITLTTIACFTQDYFQAIGVRGGITRGITYKKFLDEMKSMEAILSARDGGLQLTVIRQYHELALYQYSENIYFMKGFGVHLGYNHNTPKSWFIPATVSRFDHDIYYPLIGFDAYFGLEYRSDQIPFIFGMDYKPSFEFIPLLPPFNMHLWDIAFCIKYIF